MTDTQKNAAVEALKPCPFCGATANVSIDRASSHSFDITCWDCRAGTGISFGPEANSVEAAIAAWNQRASLPAIDTADALIREAARLIEPAEGEAVFYIRVGSEQTHMSVKTKGEVNPVAALQNAIAAIEGERKDLSNCPVHSSAPEAPSERGVGDWHPRIGEEVRPSENMIERWPDWRDTRLWVVGVTLDRNVVGNPTRVLNVCVSDEWPVTNRTGGFTDGFYINRDHTPDDLVPLSRARKIGGAS